MARESKDNDLKNPSSLRDMKRNRPRVAKNSRFAESKEQQSSPEKKSVRSRNNEGKKAKLSFEKLHLSEATKLPKARKSRAVVDLEKLKDELKQLEDPPVTQEEKKITSRRLPYSFFDVPCVELAKHLLGKILARRLEDGTVLKGRIVETEAYLGEMDKASQTYAGKVTPRNLPMYMPPGTIYVYLTYGMYHCFNISSRGKGCAVLLRALEPTVGIEKMRNHRTSRLKTRREPKISSKTLANHDLCSGPSKLCIALDIDRNHCKYSICHFKSIWIENDENNEDVKIIEAARIGIDSAGPEWANKPLRFYVYGNTSVSKRDKRAESECIAND